MIDILNQSLQQYESYMKIRLQQNSINSFMHIVNSKVIHYLPSFIKFKINQKLIQPQKGQQFLNNLSQYQNPILTLQFLQGILKLNQFLATKKQLKKHFLNWKAIVQASNKYTFQDQAVKKLVCNSYHFHQLKLGFATFAQKIENQYKEKREVLRFWRIVRGQNKIKELKNHFNCFMTIKDNIISQLNKIKIQCFKKIKRGLDIQKKLKKIMLAIKSSITKYFHNIKTYAIINDCNMFNNMDKGYLLLELNLSSKIKQRIIHSWNKIGTHSMRCMKMKKLNRNVQKIIRNKINQSFNLIYNQYQQKKHYILRKIFNFYRYKLTKKARKYFDKWKINKKLLFEKALRICRYWINNKVLHAFQQWQYQIENKKMENHKKVSNIKLKIKAKILIACVKHQIDLKQYLVKWQILCNKHYILKSVDKLALYGRINNHIGYWRLKKLLRQEKKIIQNKKIVRNMGTIEICIKIQKIGKNRVNEIFKMIKESKQKKLEMVSDIIKVEEEIQKCIEYELKNIIQKYKKNTEKQILKKKLTNIIIQTKKGKVIKVFKKWKQLPMPKNIEQIKKGNQFEKKLIQFSKRRLKSSYKLLIKDYLEGESAKKRSIIKLFNLTEIGLRKNYLNWHNKTKKDKILKECKSINNMFVTLNLLISANMTQIFTDANDLLLKQKSIGKIFENCKANIFSSLAFWKQKVRIQRMHEQMNNQKKKMILKMLEYIADRCFLGYVKKVILMFLTNSNIIEIQKKFFMKIFSTKAGFCVLAFNRWKGLPIKQSPLKKIKANKFEKKLIEFSKLKLKSTYNHFIDYQLEGEAIKKRAIIQLFNLSENGLRKNYLYWHNKTKKDKILKQCKCINGMIVSLNRLISANMTYVFTDANDLLLKQKAIGKIFENCKANIFSSLAFWKQKVRIQRMHKQMNNQKKKMILEILQYFADHGFLGYVKKVILMFLTNSNIIEIKKKFFMKIFSTKAGFCVIAFNRWKGLPIKQSPLKKIKANKFEKKLIEFSKLKLKSTYNHFIDYQLEGEAIKKRAIIQLFNLSENDLRKNYLYWHNKTKKDKILKQCKCINGMIVSLNRLISANMTYVFTDANDLLLKQKVIGKIFENCKANIFSSLAFWKLKVRIQRMQDQINNQKNKMMLEKMEDMAEQGFLGQLKKVILMFFTNSIIIEIQKKFFMKIFSTKAGFCVLAFNRWKGLPIKQSPLKKIKANQFEKNLIEYSKLKLKSTYNHFIDYQLEGEAIKKRAIIQLFNLSENGLRKNYLYWHNKTKKDKILKQCKCINGMIVSLNRLISANMTQVFTDANDLLLKQKTIGKIFENCKANIFSSLTFWKQKIRIQRMHKQMNNQKKKMILEILQYFADHGFLGYVKKVILMFLTNSNIIEIKKKFFMKIFSTKAGFCVIAFNRWKGLPIKQNPLKKIKANKFEKKLIEFSKLKLKSTYNHFIDYQLEGEAIKKRAIIQLFNLSENGLRKNYLYWHNKTKKDKILKQCKRINGMIVSLNRLISANMTQVFTDASDLLLKQKAIGKIFENCKANIYSSLAFWKQNVRIQNMQDQMNNQKKKMMLEMLEYIADHSFLGYLKKVILMFLTNSNFIEIQKKFFIKLLSTKAGQSVLAFNSWKGLPFKQSFLQKIKANKFQKNLIVFSKWRLKSTYNHLIEKYLEGEVIKKRAIIQLFNLSENGLRKNCLYWHNKTKKDKILKQCKCINNMFVSLNRLISANMTQVFTDVNDTLLKQKAIAKIFDNCKANFYASLQSWKSKVLFFKLQSQFLFQQNMILLSQKQSFVSTFFFNLNSIVKWFSDFIYFSQSPMQKILIKLTSSHRERFIKIFNTWKNNSLILSLNLQQSNICKRFFIISLKEIYISHRLHLISRVINSFRKNYLNKEQIKLTMKSLLICCRYSKSKLFSQFKRIVSHLSYTQDKKSLSIQMLNYIYITHHNNLIHNYFIRWIRKITAAVIREWKLQYFMIGSGSLINKFLLHKEKKKFQLTFGKWKFNTFYKYRNLVHAFTKFSAALNKKLNQIFDKLKRESIFKMYKRNFSMQQILLTIYIRKLISSFLSFKQFTDEKNESKNKIQKMFSIIKAEVFQYSWLKIKASKLKFERFARIIIPILHKKYILMLHNYFQIWQYNPLIKIYPFVRTLSNFMQNNLKYLFIKNSEQKLVQKIQSKYKSLFLSKDLLKKKHLLILKFIWNIWAHKENPWFKKAIRTMAWYSRINVQVSIWRFVQFFKEVKQEKKFLDFDIKFSKAMRTNNQVLKCKAFCTLKKTKTQKTNRLKKDSKQTSIVSAGYKQIAVLKLEVTLKNKFRSDFINLLEKLNPLMIVRNHESRFDVKIRKIGGVFIMIAHIFSYYKYNMHIILNRLLYHNKNIDIDISNISNIYSDLISQDQKMKKLQEQLQVQKKEVKRLQHIIQKQMFKKK